MYGPIHIGIRANIHLGGQTEFSPNGERKKHNELLQSLFFYGRRVVHDERLLCYPTWNVSQVDGYLLRSVTQLVKQMCCLLPE